MINHGNKWFMVAWLCAVMYDINIGDCTDVLNLLYL